MLTHHAQGDAPQIQDSLQRIAQCRTVLTFIPGAYGLDRIQRVVRRALPVLFSGACNLDVAIAFKGCLACVAAFLRRCALSARTRGSLLAIAILELIHTATIPPSRSGNCIASPFRANTFHAAAGRPFSPSVGALLLCLLCFLSGCTASVAVSSEPIEKPEPKYWRVVSDGESWYAQGEVETANFLNNPWFWASFTNINNGRVTVYSARHISITQVSRDDAMQAEAQS